MSVLSKMKSEGKLLVLALFHAFFLSVSTTLALTVTVNDNDAIKKFFVLQFTLRNVNDFDQYRIYYAYDTSYTTNIYVRTVGASPDILLISRSSTTQCGQFMCGQQSFYTSSSNFYLSPSSTTDQKIISFTGVAFDSNYALQTTDPCKFDNFQIVPSFPPTYPALTKCTAGSGGDPHFRTWGGLDFDFMGSCDLVLLKGATFSNGVPFRIHIRTVIEQWWSFVEKIAFQVGTDTVEIQVSEGKLLRNGLLLVDPIVQIGGSVIFKKHEHYNQNTNTLHFTYVVSDSGVDVIQINGVDGKKREIGIFFVHPTIEMYARSVGMMGTYPSGQMVSSGGENVISDANSFGENWRVRKDVDPQLFQKTAGYPLENCIYPPVTDKPKLMTLEQAKNVCKNEKSFFNFCVQDMLATGDYEVAEVYETNVLEKSYDILLFEAKLACSVSGKYEEYCIKEVLSTKDLSVADEFFDVGTTSYF